jgi:hypothetical protein
MKTALCTFPGKLGDLLYSLPAVRQLKSELKIDRIDFMTSSYCANITRLLAQQPCIDGAYVDRSYYMTSDAFGIQPADMSETGYYDKVFHLGFVRQILGNIMAYQHLALVHYKTLSDRYGIKLEPDITSPFLSPYGFEKMKVVTFHAHSKSIYQNVRYKQVGEKLNETWKKLIAGIKKMGYTVRAITDPDGALFHKQFDVEIMECHDAVDAAEAIDRSAMFLGVQSFPYVIAEGLRAPRMIAGVFKHVMPVGKNKNHFKLDEPPKQILERIKKILDA